MKSWVNILQSFIFDNIQSYFVLEEHGFLVCTTLPRHNRNRKIYKFEEY